MAAFSVFITDWYYQRVASIDTNRRNNGCMRVVLCESYTILQLVQAFPTGSYIPYRSLPNRLLYPVPVSITLNMN